MVSFRLTSCTDCSWPGGFSAAADISVHSAMSSIRLVLDLVLLALGAILVDVANKTMAMYIVSFVRFGRGISNMKIRRVHWWLVPVVTIAIVASFLPTTGLSGLLVINFPAKITRRARVHRALPTKYSFGQQRVVNGNRRFSTAVTPPSISRVVNGPDVRHKTFTFSAGVGVDNIQLNRIGVSLYDSGHIAATGIIAATDTSDSKRLAYDVEIHLRAYGGTAAPALAPNGPILCESTVHLRLKPNRPKAVSLTQCRCCPLVKKHFDEITHIEVRLEHTLPKTTSAERGNQ